MEINSNDNLTAHPVESESKKRGAKKHKRKVQEKTTANELVPRLLKPPIHQSGKVSLIKINRDCEAKGIP